MVLIDLTNSMEWNAETAYSVGDVLRDSNIPDGYIATCTVAGTSGTTEPEWQVGTLKDGTCTWSVSVDPNYYEKATKASAQAAAESAAQSAKSAQAAETAATSAGSHALSASESEKNSKSYADNASASASSASTSADNAKMSETNAKASETASADSAKSAHTSETNAKASETNAAKSAEEAENSAKQAAENILATYIASAIKAALDERTKAMYPVGCYFYSDDSRAPSEYIPGLEGTTWEQTAAGRVLIGAGTADSGTVYKAGDKGGEEKHKLSADENGPHTHDCISGNGSRSSATRWAIVGTGVDTLNKGDVYNFNATQSSGDGKPHNNMQPYHVVFIFKRTA